MSWEGRSQPLGESDPHGEHFHHEQLLVQAARASEGNARVQSQSLDAVPVEAGVLAHGTPHGFVGDCVFHGVQADAAGVVLAGTWLQCLLWAMLPAEGPVRKVGEMGEARGEGSAESLGCDGDVGAGAVREPQPLCGFCPRLCQVAGSCPCGLLPCMAIAEGKDLER